jgi:hypothetical protein
MNTLPIKRVSVLRSALAVLLAAFSLPVTFAGQDGAAPDSLRGPLREGVTTFVAALPKDSDRFTFINENAAVRGKLEISVANEKLAASDPRWTVVDGAIVFNRKRQFTLSMVGVEANYVKLSFHIEKGERMAALGL